MENASDALIMAFGVLVFVLALSISISLFGQVRETSNIVFSLIDRESDYIYVDPNTAKSSTRTVEIETVISSLYRAYEENYIILFYKKNGDKYNIYETISGDEINFIDKTDEILRGEKWMNDVVGKSYYSFLECLISGKNGDTKKYFKYIDETKGLYEKLNGKKITEYLGEYYEDELEDKTSTSEVNRQKKRIITYVIE